MCKDISQGVARGWRERTAERCPTPITGLGAEATGEGAGAWSGLPSAWGCRWWSLSALRPSSTRWPDCWAGGVICPCARPLKPRLDSAGAWQAAIHVLRGEPQRISDSARLTGHPQATISRHPGTLRSGGIVSAHRRTQAIVSQIANTKIVQIGDLMQEVLVEEPARRSQLRRGWQDEHPR